MNNYIIIHVKVVFSS